MRNFLVSLIFFTLLTGIIWSSLSATEKEVKGAYPGHDKNCPCSATKLSEARRARELCEFLFDFGL